VRVSAILLLTALGCSVPGPDPQEIREAESHEKFREKKLADKVAELTEKYKRSGEPAESIARAVVSGCSREISDLANAQIETLCARATYQHEVDYLRRRRPTIVESIRNDVWGIVVEEVVASRADGKR